MIAGIEFTQIRFSSCSRTGIPEGKLTQPADLEQDVFGIIMMKQVQFISTVSCFSQEAAFAQLRQQQRSVRCRNDVLFHKKYFSCVWTVLRSSFFQCGR